MVPMHGTFAVEAFHEPKLEFQIAAPGGGRTPLKGHPEIALGMGNRVTPQQRLAVVRDGEQRRPVAEVGLTGSL